MRHPFKFMHLLAPLWLALAAGGAAASVAAPAGCGAVASAVTVAAEVAAGCLTGAAGTLHTSTAAGNDGGWLRLGSAAGAPGSSSARLLSGTVTGTSGVVSISAAAWDIYDHLALGLYVGDGADGNSNAADWILLALPDGALTASWATLAQPVRYAALYGVNGPVQLLQSLPEPGSIALAGLALAGLVLTRQAVRKARPVAPPQPAG